MAVNESVWRQQALPLTIQCYSGGGGRQAAAGGGLLLNELKGHFGHDKQQNKNKTVLPNMG